MKQIQLPVIHPYSSALDGLEEQLESHRMHLIIISKCAGDEEELVHVFPHRTVRLCNIVTFLFHRFDFSLLHVPLQH